MLKRNVNIGALMLLFLLILSSCGDYSKILQSTDYDFKYKKALEYYEDGEYVRAATLLRDVVNVYRGTSEADDIYYYYAKSFEGMGDYLLAGQYYRSLLSEFPGSDYAEEAQFMSGYCYAEESPKPRLDQTVTQNAIDALLLFKNLYPASDRIAEADSLIFELQEKLVYKSYLTGKLYYDMGNYKAAVVALTNSIEDFPETDYREDLMFMLLESKYLLAVRSVDSKKDQRLSEALDEYFTFVDEFPESEHRKDAEEFYEVTADLLNYSEEITE